MAGVRIALELLLHQHRQAVEALAHVGVARRKPHPRAARDCNHHRGRLPSALTSAETVEASTGPVIRIRPPVANSISIVPAVSATGSGVAASGAIATGLNVVDGTGGCAQSCCRQRNN